MQSLLDETTTTVYDVTCIQRYKENISEFHKTLLFEKSAHFFNLLLMYFRAILFTLPSKREKSCVLLLCKKSENTECWIFLILSLYPCTHVTSQAIEVFSFSFDWAETLKIHNSGTDCLTFLKLSLMCFTNIAVFTQPSCLLRWTCPFPVSVPYRFIWDQFVSGTFCEVDGENYWTKTNFPLKFTEKHYAALFSWETQTVVLTKL